MRTSGLSECALSLILCGALYAQNAPPSANPGEGEARPHVGDTVPARTPANARLLCATSKWTVWGTQDLIESTRRRHAPSLVWRYFRQQRGSDTAVLSYEEKGTRPLEVSTVLDDGTILFSTRVIIGWLRPNGEWEGESNEVQVVAGWPDGIVTQAYDLNKCRPVSFIPILDGRLQKEKRIQLTSDRGVEVNLPPDFVRLNDSIAWVFESVVHVVDIRTSKRVDFPIDIITRVRFAHPQPKYG